MADKTHVAPRDPGKKNSPLAGPSEGESTVVLDAAAASCTWNGVDFPDGAMVECDGIAYECAFGQWVKTG